MQKSGRMLFLLSFAELLAMTVWFSVSAVGPALVAEFNLTATQLAALVMAVQFGFVIGTLTSAIFNLADVFNTRHFITISAIMAAIVNAAYVIVTDNFIISLAVRFLTGFFLAGIYPPGMKVLAGWFKKGRGLAIGIMVGALAVGTAMPHTVGAFLRQDWRLTILMSSAMAVLSALIVVIFVEDGPFDVPARKFDLKYVFKIFRSRPVRLAYFGYFGHMWELYAVWTWLAIYLFTVLQTRPDALPFSSGVAAFLVIAAGGVGCVIYGAWAEKIGRSRSTIVAMAVSGLCCFTIGFLPLNPVVIFPLCLIWGTTVVADSAQFSTAATELCEPEYMGTVLTLQTSIGFLITIISIRLVPVVQEMLGWGWAFAMLGLGPVFGIWAMASLYRSPEAIKMAGGKR